MPAAEIYAELRSTYAAREQDERRRSLAFSWARGTVFTLLAVALLVILIHARAPRTAAPLAATLCLVAFVALAVGHARVIARERRWGEMRAINEEALARLARDWSHLPLPRPAMPAREFPPIAHDLDLFGQASLFHLLGTAHSPAAKTALTNDLLAARPPAEIAARQRAVSELALSVDFRQRLEAATRRFEVRGTTDERFLEWAESAPWLRARPWLLGLVRALTVATIAAVAAAIATPLPGTVVLAAIAINLLVTRFAMAVLKSSFDRIGGSEDEFQLYADALEVAVSEKGWTASLLVDLPGRLAPRGRAAHGWMRRLHRIVELADARHSALLHLPLQSLLLWDFHVLARFERWQGEVGKEVRGWLSVLGELEELAAFAVLRYDEPDWCLPAVTDEADRLDGRGLAHPLLSAARVGNDVTVGPAGTFLLLTGSNMSGKSTLLRSLGANVVLAQAGAPACAAELRLPPLRIGTSILIEDSLASGVSLFMAELLRIREVVALARQSASGGARTLYLLDEILRGTNSAERREAVRRVLGHLLAAGAIGAISTHDLELVAAPELAGACQAKHFRETLRPSGERPLMTFDYLLRPGLASTRNALALLDLVGLGPETAA